MSDEIDNAEEKKAGFTLSGVVVIVSFFLSWSLTTFSICDSITIRSVYKENELRLEQKADRYIAAWSKEREIKNTVVNLIELLSQQMSDLKEKAIPSGITDKMNKILSDITKNSTVDSTQKDTLIASDCMDIR